MSDIEEKALALVRKEDGKGYLNYDAAIAALCRAVEQHEAFRQEVSDALLTKMNEWCEAVAVEWGQGSQTHNVARDGVDIVRAALEQSK